VCSSDLKNELKNAASSTYSTETIDTPPGKIPFNPINARYPDRFVPTDEDETEEDEKDDKDFTHEVSRGRLRYEDRTYANAFQYAEAIFADIAYLMQDILKTKVDELKKMKEEIAQANDCLALLNGATKDGSKGRNIKKVSENASEAEAEEARKDGRWNVGKGDGTYRMTTKEARRFELFCEKELGMSVNAHWISNEDYDKLKTKLESYISSRQTDMQKLSTDIQSIKDKFDQMWRLVGGLISMEGDLNKTLVGNIR